MRSEPIETAPKDGTPILAECNNESGTYVASVAYWTVEMLREASSGGTWTKEEEYWSLTPYDFCCEPLRWFPDFEMPSGVKVES